MDREAQWTTVHSGHKELDTIQWLSSSSCIMTLGPEISLDLSSNHLRSLTVFYFVFCTSWDFRGCVE